MKHRKNILSLIVTLLLICSSIIGGCGLKDSTVKQNESSVKPSETKVPDKTENDTYTEISVWDGETAYVTVNDNKPTFTDDEITTESFESYSELDNLGRCGIATACISKDTMPTEERGEIGQVKPSGWHTVKYPEVISENYLYNRCHLIGYQLTGENANKQNLITGTRYLNVTGMLPFENEVADYVKSTGNHVMYRVTPVFIGDELVARGVYMEAYSVEDNGNGVSYNVYCFNNQPGVEIDYTTGESKLAEITGEAVK